MTSERGQTNPPSWLSGWLRDATAQARCHSMVMAATCGTDLHRIASDVTVYLNEFDGEGGSQWRPFSVEELRQLAGDPTSRSLVLAGWDHLGHGSDLDRISRRLALLGGVILEGQGALDATEGVREAFRICLCQGDHASHDDFHMWINPKLFSPESLTCIIADSFLNWSSDPDAHSNRFALAKSKP